METNETIYKAKSPRLPEFPDYPASPVKGWVFYGIVRFADQKIRQQISELQKPILLTGLRVLYQFVQYDTKEPEEYAMQFGQEISEEDPGSDVPSPLGDQFVLELFGEIERLLKSHLTEKGRITFVRFGIVLQEQFMVPPPPGGTPTALTLSVACMLCDEHPVHQGMVTKHRKEFGVWKCKSIPCPSVSLIG